MPVQSVLSYTAALFAGIAVSMAATAAEPVKAPPAPPAKAAVPSKSLETTVNTESVISGISAMERTRPFPVAEKVAYFVNIKDGDKVRSPFRVAFSVTGMGVAPVAAGKIEGTGHHHILIDMPMPADIKKPIPFDKPEEYLNQRYKHFGKGETEAVLDLPPGKHTLRLLFADHNHVPYYIASKEITIEVMPK
ncbi:DUF4399 domain-containing protein [Noviherbaspirillum sp.]|uniref:DUF4399 domain-containing protein n=1 Tax=Noviherbaspirillum sp. TaxID=1926288 RepID=UPI002FE20507